MDVRLLGPVEAHVDGRAVPVGPGKPRALLAMLSLHAGSAVSSDRLVAALWGEEPPATAAKLVQLHVSQLRRSLSDDGARLVTRGHGYELRLRPDDLDVTRFERLVERGRPRDALALWRGPALADVGEPFAAVEARRLEELRLAALEQAIDADLRAGRHRELVGELERLVTEEPLREKLHEQRMLALYRSGRQADALAAFLAARATLDEEIGIEPGPGLRRLHEAILHQDPALELTPPPPDLVVCPYKGLASFDVGDSAFFFGRERLVAELVARATDTPLIGIVGASGSGKSSLLRAGVLAALDRDVLPGSARRPVAVLRPGEHPVASLERAMAEAGAGDRPIVAVDQFEELFTACRDERERVSFADALTALAGDRQGRTLVLIAIRADFYGRCADYPALARLLAAGHALVGRMRRDELRRAIELPARRAGLDIEPELVDALLAGVEGRPAALPLLSTALVELWQHRDGRRMGIDAYHRAGGVEGAVSRLAERAYERLDPEARVLARRIFLRLAGDGDGDAVVGRRVPLDDFEEAGTAEVLGVLAQERLVAIGDGEVEVAHEALLREWPRLRGWLDEDADGRRTHRRLVEAARAWSQGGRDRGDLYRGARLASALEWRVAHESELSATERDFLDAARAEGERARRRLRFVISAIVALLVFAALAAAFAFEQRGRARAETRAAEAQALGAQAVNEEQLDRALLLARQSVSLDDAPQTRDNLLAVLRRSPAAIGVMRGDGDPLTALAVHPDGRTLAVGDADGTIHFLDAETRRRVSASHQVRWTSRISSLAFSPDGSRLASAGWAPSGAVVDIFDARSHRHLTRLGDLPYARETSARFSPDSRLVAAYDAFGGDNRVIVWDVGTRREVAAATVGVSSNLLGFLGSRLVTSTADRGETVVRDAASLRAIRRFPVSGTATAVSSAAGLVAFGGDDGSVRILDVERGEQRVARGRHSAPVVALAFDAEGDRLVSAGSDGRLIVWDAGRATALEHLEGHGLGLVRDLQVAPDGLTAYSAGHDGTVVAWDLSGERRWERPFGGPSPYVAGSLTSGGGVFAAVDARGVVDVYDSRTLRRLARFGAGRRTTVRLTGDPDFAAAVRPAGVPVTGAAVAADGRTLALMRDDGQLAFWDIVAERRLGPWQTAHAHPAWALTFSADGRWLATGGGDALVRLWDARRRTASTSVALGDDHQAVADLGLSPDGETLAVTLLNESASGGLEIRSVPSLDLIRTVPLPPGTVGRFSDDGSTLVYGGRDGRVWMLDARTWEPRGRPLRANAAVLTVDLSTDGGLLATTSTDRTGRLWDVATGRPVGAALSGSGRDPIAAAFVDGERLAVLHDRGGVTWDLTPEAWAAHACAVAGRPLTRAEWESALPRHDYAPVCGRP